LSKKIWIGLLISLVALGLAIKDVHFSELVAALKQVRYFYILSGTTLVIIMIGFRTVRWQILLRPSLTIPFWDLFSINMIGFMANNVLPARLGELVRVYLVGSRGKISKSSSLAVIVVERLFDSFVVLGVLAFSFAYLRTVSVPVWLWSTGLAVSILTFAVLLFLIFLILFSKKVTPVLERLLNFLPLAPRTRLLNMFNSFVAGLGILRKARHLWQAALLSLVVWGLQMVIFLVGFIAFNFHLPIAALFTILLFTSFGVAIPSSPAYIGTYQIAIVASLAIFHIDSESAFGYSLVIHAMQAFPVTILGLIFLWRQHLSLKQLSKVKVSNETTDNLNGDTL